MKLARSAFLVLALAASAAACTDDGGTGPDPVDLSGDYSVQTFEYEADDGSASLDLATIPPGQGGPMGITEMTVESDHSFAGTLKLPQGGTVVTLPIGGDIEITGANTLRIDFDATTDSYEVLDDFEDGTFQLSGNTLTIVLPEVTFDFTLSGQPPEDADLTIVGTRS